MVLAAMLAEVSGRGQEAAVLVLQTLTPACVTKEKELKTIRSRSQ